MFKRLPRGVHGQMKIQRNRERNKQTGRQTDRRTAREAVSVQKIARRGPRSDEKSRAVTTEKEKKIDTQDVDIAP